jgi:hypothetical protein
MKPCQNCLLTHQNPGREDYEGRKAAFSRSLEAEREANATAVHTTFRSEHIMDRLRAKRFLQIFNYLDQVRKPVPETELLGVLNACISCTSASCVSSQCRRPFYHVANDHAAIVHLEVICIQKGWDITCWH